METATGLSRSIGSSSPGLRLKANRSAAAIFPIGNRSYSTLTQHRDTINTLVSEVKNRTDMTTLEEVEHLLARLNRAEKAQVLQWVARDLGGVYPGIESRANVNGGEACIVRTRIPVRLLVQARQLGASEANLLQSYPTLRAEDLSNAWAYARNYSTEIAQQILENETA